MKLYVCKRCDHEWIDENVNCHWCNCEPFYIGEFDNPLTISDEEIIDPLHGVIKKIKNILRTNDDKKDTKIRYTYKPK